MLSPPAPVPDVSAVLPRGECGVDAAALVPALAADVRLVEGLRQVVAEGRYDGVPVSQIVHSFFAILRRHGRLTAPGCRPLLALAELALALAHPQGMLAALPGRLPLDIARWQGRILIAAGGEQERSRRLWQPLAGAFGPAEGLLVAGGRSQLRHLPAGLPAVVLSDFPPAWLATRRWLLARLGRWLRGLAEVCADCGFAPAARWRLAAQLVHQTGKIATALGLCERLKPRALVVNWDRNPIGSVLCAALSSRGVPTFTLVHGAFGAQNQGGFLPLGARFVLTWGDIHTELLRGAGVPAERLIPVGVFEPRPVRRRLDDAGRAARLEQLGADPGKPVVVVGLTCLAASERRVWADILGELANRLPEFVVLGRLHPSNSRASFAELLQENSRLRLVDDRLLNAKQTLELADLVVVDSSSFGFDAIQHEIPVLVLEPPDGSGYFSLMREAMAAGAALYARDVGQLAAQVESLWNDPALRQRQLERARAFEARYVCAYGQEALARVRAAIESVLAETRKPGAGPSPDTRIGV